METRTIMQAKIHYLVMNQVTDRAESGKIAAMSIDKEKLIQFYQNERVDIYNDGNFSKVFKKDGPLEWFNPLWTLDGVDTFGHGVYSDWVDMENIHTLQTKYFFI